MVLQFKRLMASGELPKAKPRYASIEGATELEVQELAKVVNPLRILLRMICHKCYYRWQAPALGACPQCHEVKWVERLEEVVCMAKRI
jgi:hypothetical protein